MSVYSHSGTLQTWPVGSCKTPLRQDVSSYKQTFILHTAADTACTSESYQHVQ